MKKLFLINALLTVIFFDNSICSVAKRTIQEEKKIIETTIYEKLKSTIYEKIKSKDFLLTAAIIATSTAIIALLLYYYNQYKKEIEKIKIENIDLAENIELTIQEIKSEKINQEIIDQIQLVYFPYNYTLTSKQNENDEKIETIDLLIEGEKNVLANKDFSYENLIASNKFNIKIDNIIKLYSLCTFDGFDILQISKYLYKIGKDPADYYKTTNHKIENISSEDLSLFSKIGKMSTEDLVFFIKEECPENLLMATQTAFSLRGLDQIIQTKKSNRNILLCKKGMEVVGFCIIEKIENHQKEATESIFIDLIAAKTQKIGIGNQLLKSIRTNYELPIILISGRSTSEYASGPRFYLKNGFKAFSPKNFINTYKIKYPKSTSNIKKIQQSEFQTRSLYMGAIKLKFQMILIT